MNFHFVIFLAGQDELVVLRMQVSGLLYYHDAHFVNWLRQIELIPLSNIRIMDPIVHQQYQTDIHRLYMFS